MDRRWFETLHRILTIVYHFLFLGVNILSFCLAHSFGDQFMIETDPIPIPFNFENTGSLFDGLFYIFWNDIFKNIIIKNVILMINN